MKIQKECFLLKDGRGAVMRSPEDADAEKMLKYLHDTARETDFLLRTPQESGRYSAEKERALFAKLNADERSAMVLCLVEDRIAGVCQISASDRVKTAHRAGIGIAVLKEFWGLGIGTRLLEKITDIGREIKGVIQLELEFIEGNSRACALYEKAGFRTVGVHPNAVRMSDGALRHEYLMIKEIE